MSPKEPALLIVSPNYHPRTCGVGDNSAQLGRELLRRGRHVLVLTRSPAEPHPDAQEVPVIGFEGGTPLLVVRRMLRWLTNRPCDRVIVQYTPQMFGAWRFGSPAIPFLVRSLRQRGIDVTVVGHELFLPWSCRPDILLAALLHRLQLASVARAAASLAVTTEGRVNAAAPWLRLALVRQAPSIIRIGPNVAPVAWNPASTGLRVGSFSTLAAGKRFEVVLEAFTLIARAVPDAELWLLGDMLARHDRMTDSFRRAVDAHPEADRIRLPGKQPLSVIAESIASLHVFLFPMDAGATTRSGTLPIALGAGVPVVAARGIETDPIFVDRKNVLFARSLSGDAFADAALCLHHNPELARKISDGGRRLHDKYLAWPRIVDILLKQARPQGQRAGK